jgi:hypothetical protein
LTNVRLLSVRRRNAYPAGTIGGMADPPRRWFRFRIRTLLLLTFLTVVALSIYSYASDYWDQATRRQRELLSPAKGAYCIVFLDEPPSNGSSEKLVYGRFYLMNNEWLVLDAEGSKQEWIPRQRVRRVQVEVGK